MASTAPVASTGVTSPPHTTADADHEEEDVDPQVAGLKAMFPDFDGAVLQSVLDSVDGNEDQAIDVLLGMSDPDYVSSTAQPAPPQVPAHDNDTSMDEQLARQLYLEDEEERNRGRRNATGELWTAQRTPATRRADQISVPYEPRQRNNNQGQQSGYVTGSERGDFQDLQETVNRIAESGKRTFASIVSKAKAKINELNQGGGGGGASNSAPAYPPTASFQNAPGVSSQPQAYDSMDYGRTQGAGMDRHARTEIYGAGGGEWTSASRRSSANAPPAAHTPVQVQPQNETRGYDVGEPMTPPAVLSSSVQRSTSPVQVPTTPPALPRGNSMDIPKPPATSAGSPINAAKLGLLPKRPVSLLNSQPPSEQRVQPPEDDDDDLEYLEYLENPFEEEKRK